jgi:3-hydroxyacyl-[acyl-carrier-protein] dehydratase
MQDRSAATAEENRPPSPASGLLLKLDAAPTHIDDASPPMSTHQQALTIAADHPSLAGHFPGNPVVPGVVVLDHVLDAVEAWLGELPAELRLPQVKFMQPLLPDQAAEIELRRDGSRLRFAVRRDGALIASGELELAA